MILNTTKKKLMHVCTPIHINTHKKRHTHNCVVLCNPHYCHSCTCPSICKCHALNINITHFAVIMINQKLHVLWLPALLQIIILVWWVQLHSVHLLNMKTRCFIILANHCLALFQVQKVPNIIHTGMGQPLFMFYFWKKIFGLVNGYWHVCKQLK